MAEALEKLAEGLPDSHKSEFFRVLHETGIKEHDVVLAKLLRTLQLYKSYYEVIPDFILKAVAEIEKLKKDIEKLTLQASQSAEAGETSLNHLRQETAQVNESLKNLHSHVEEAASKASASVSKSMLELISNTVKAELHIDQFKEAGQAISSAINSSNQASAELRANIKVIRWAHIGVFALAACVLLLSSWGYFYYRYVGQIEKTRADIFSRIDGNTGVLLELSKSNRRIELVEEGGEKLLVIKNATGWTSKNRHGVIRIE
jgi:FtsZ-binding cell division protein ZapB